MLSPLPWRASKGAAAAASACGPSATEATGVVASRFVLIPALPGLALLLHLAYTSYWSSASELYLLVYETVTQQVEAATVFGSPVQSVAVVILGLCLYPALAGSSTKGAAGHGSGAVSGSLRPTASATASGRIVQSHSIDGFEDTHCRGGAGGGGTVLRGLSAASGPWSRGLRTLLRKLPRPLVVAQRSVTFSATSSTALAAAPGTGGAGGGGSSSCGDGLLVDVPFSRRRSFNGSSSKGATFKSASDGAGPVASTRFLLEDWGLASTGRGTHHGGSRHAPAPSGSSGSGAAAGTAANSGISRKNSSSKWQPSMSRITSGLNLNHQVVSSASSTASKDDKAVEVLAYTGCQAVDCLAHEATAPTATAVKQVVLDEHVLQLGALLGEASAKLALGQQGASSAVGRAPVALFGPSDCPAQHRDGWEPVVEEHAAGLHYWAWRRHLRKGLFIYLSKSVFERTTPQQLVSFTFNDSFRPSWDDTCVALHAIVGPDAAAPSPFAVASGPVPAKALALPAEPGCQSAFMFARTKFPAPMASREYVYARRVWDKPDDGGCYCVSRSCPGVYGVGVPSQGGRTVLVDDYASGYVIRGCAAYSSPNAPATEQVSMYFEDSHVRSGIINMGVRRGLWPQVQKTEAALRRHIALHATAPLPRRLVLASPEEEEAGQGSNQAAGRASGAGTGPGGASATGPKRWAAASRRLGCLFGGAGATAQQLWRRMWNPSAVARTVALPLTYVARQGALVVVAVRQAAGLVHVAALRTCAAMAHAVVLAAAWALRAAILADHAAVMAAAKAVLTVLRQARGGEAAIAALLAAEEQVEQRQAAVAAAKGHREEGGAQPPSAFASMRAQQLVASQQQRRVGRSMARRCLQVVSVAVKAAGARILHQQLARSNSGLSGSEELSLQALTEMTPSSNSSAPLAARPTNAGAGAATPRRRSVAGSEDVLVYRTSRDGAASAARLLPARGNASDPATVRHGASNGPRNNGALSSGAGGAARTNGGSLTRDIDAYTPTLLFPALGPGRVR